MFLATTWQPDNQLEIAAASDEGRERRQPGRVVRCRCPWGLGEWAWSGEHGVGLIESLTPEAEGGRGG